MVSVWLLQGRDAVNEARIDQQASIQRAIEAGAQPLVLRGAAREWPAFVLWNDSFLQSDGRGNATLDTVELARNETRAAAELKYLSLGAFVRHYERRDMYAVAGVPVELRGDVILPQPICCLAEKLLEEVLLWFSAGDTRSVIHSDSEENLLCVLDGQKRLALWDRAYKPLVETAAFGWRESTGKDATYGGFAGPPILDVDDIDLERFPGWNSLRWKEALLHPGDCLYIPKAWYHHVYSPPGRNLAINFWWRRADAELRQPACAHAQLRNAACILSGCHVAKDFVKPHAERLTRVAPNMARGCSAQRAPENGRRNGAVQIALRLDKAFRRWRQVAANLMHDAVLPILKDDQSYQRAGLLLSILLLSLALSRALKLLSGTENAIRRALAKVAAVLFGVALSLGCVASCAGHRTNGRGAAAEPEPGLVASHFDHLGCVASVTAAWLPLRGGLAGDVVLALSAGSALRCLAERSLVEHVKHGEREAQMLAEEVARDAEAASLIATVVEQQQPRRWYSADLWMQLHRALPLPSIELLRGAPEHDRPWCAGALLLTNVEQFFIWPRHSDPSVAAARSSTAEAEEKGADQRARTLWPAVQRAQWLDSRGVWWTAQLEECVQVAAATDSLQHTQSAARSHASGSRLNGGVDGGRGGLGDGEQHGGGGGVDDGAHGGDGGGAVGGASVGSGAGVDGAGDDSGGGDLGSGDAGPGDGFEHGYRSTPAVADAEAAFLWRSQVKDVVSALLTSDGAVETWELVVRCHLAFTFADADISDGDAALEELLGVMVAAGDAHPSLRSSLYAIAEPWLHGLSLGSRKAARSVLAFLQVGELWGPCGDFARARLPPQFATLNAWLGSDLLQANTQHAIARLAQEIRPRGRYSWRSHMFSSDEDLVDASFKIMHLFPSHVVTARVQDGALLSQLRGLALTMFKKASRAGRRPSSEAFFQLQMQQQSRLLALPPFKRAHDIARCACVHQVLASLPKPPSARLRRKLLAMRLSLWANVLWPEDGQQRRVHEGSVCSGALHVSAPPRAPPLLFDDPRGSLPHAPETTPSVAQKLRTRTEADGVEAAFAFEHAQPPFIKQVAFFPEEGELIVFPSFLAHSVPKDARGKAVDNSSELDEAGQLQIFYSFTLDAAQLMSGWDVAASAG